MLSFGPDTKFFQNIFYLNGRSQCNSDASIMLSGFLICICSVQIGPAVFSFYLNGPTLYYDPYACLLSSIVLYYTIVCSSDLRACSHDL